MQVDAIETIKTRRSVRKFKDQVPSKALILQILDAARRGPNHHNTEPWHFFVLTGDGRDKLGKVYGRLNVKKLRDPDQQVINTAMAKGLAKARRAPLLIVVTIEPSDSPKVVRVEEIAATACAVENMLLAIHAFGLGAIWRTGDASYTDEMKQAFAVSENGLVLGYLYVGYPQDDYHPPVRERKSVEEIADWVES